MAWEAEHMLPEMQRHFAEDGTRGIQAYFESVLSILGLKLPMNRENFKKRWPELLREKLNIKVTLYRRRTQKIDDRIVAGLNPNYELSLSIEWITLCPCSFQAARPPSDRYSDSRDR